MPQPIAFTRPDQRQVELLPWTDRDLDDMAMVTDEDRSRAASYWRMHLPRRYRALLDAISTVASGIPVV